jgi:hypothetical protein
MVMGTMCRACLGIAALMVAATGVPAANVYKCKTADGGVVVSNTPCARGAEPDAKLSSGSQPVVYEDDGHRARALPAQRTWSS